MKTTEVVVSKKQALAIRKEKELDQVSEKLNNVQLLIAKAGLENQIRYWKDNELVKKIAIMSKMVCRDLGIKTWNNESVMRYESSRFYDVLKMYYRNLTIEEVKLAFELASVGKLDEYLPKDKNQKPDKNHYQSFSVEFTTKILNAYQLSKKEVLSNINKLLPVKTKTATDEEKAEYRKAFINDIATKFEAYKNEAITPRFLAPSVVVREFVKCGLLESEPEISEDSIEMGFIMAMTNGGISPEEKSNIMSKKANGEVPRQVVKFSSRNQNNKTIVQVFDILIKTSRTINEVICQK